MKEMEIIGEWIEVFGDKPSYKPNTNNSYYQIYSSISK